MDEKYKKLFNFVDETKRKQELQKIRGLNDYNMVNVVRKAHEEVGMHSNVIYSLLDPNGLHYQGDLFLKIFISKVLGITDFGEVYSVNAEEATDEKKRVDFTIKSNKYLIGIEMKVYHHDSDKQIESYYNHLCKEDSDKDVLIYYLTLNCKSPSKESKGTVADENIKKISFKKNILNWITLCQAEVKNITNLNVFLESYKQIIEKITNQYKGSVVTIVEELQKSENEALLRQAIELDKHMLDLKGEILFSFFKKVKDILVAEKFEDVSDKINDRDRVVCLKKCKRCFNNDNTDLKKGCKSEYFGLFFDCGFKKDIYFHMQIGIRNLHFGVVKCSNNEKLEILNMEAGEHFNGLKFNTWANWYSKDAGKIVDLNDESLKYILDFEHSNLKDEIFSTINAIKLKS